MATSNHHDYEFPGKVFVAAATVVQLIIWMRLLVLCYNCRDKLKRRLREACAKLGFLIWGQQASLKDQRLLKESQHIQLQMARWAMYGLICVHLLVLSLGQRSVMASERYFFSLPQLFNATVNGGLCAIFLVCPGCLRSSTTNAFYIVLNAVILTGLLPSHCAPEDLLISTCYGTITRFISIALASRSRLVLMINILFLVLIFSRRTLDDYNVVDSAGLGKVDPTLIWRLEMFTTAGMFGMSCIYSATIRMKVENMEASNVSSQLSAASSILRLTCDAVVELDSDLRFTEDSPQLSAALLLGGGAEGTLKGRLFTELMQPPDARRAEELLRKSQRSEDELITAQAFHTRLVDSYSSKICVEIFQVRYSKSDGCEYHLLGVRDFTDIKNLAAGNAVDAGIEAVEGDHCPLNDSQSASDAEDCDLESNCKPTSFLEVDMEGMVVHSASAPWAGLAGTACDDAFPSPQTLILLEHLRSYMSIFQTRGEMPPKKILNYQDMPAVLSPPTVDHISGSMQIMPNRFGRFTVLMAFEQPHTRPGTEVRRRSSRRSSCSSPARSMRNALSL